MDTRDNLARLAAGSGSSIRLYSSEGYGKAVILAELSWMCGMWLAMLCGRAFGILSTAPGPQGPAKSDGQNKGQVLLM